MDAREHSSFDPIVVTQIAFDRLPKETGSRHTLLAYGPIDFFEQMNWQIEQDGLVVSSRSKH